MVARVTLEIALRKDFDYSIPDSLAGMVGVGTRVKVPFGSRELIGCVTALMEESEGRPGQKLKPIIKIIGEPSLVTHSVLRLARWMAEYYCCPPELALKGVLPVAVRREQKGWREQLWVELAVGRPEETLTAPQRKVVEFLEKGGQFLQAVLKGLKCSPSTLRRLEDRGVLTIGLKRSERDPYEGEHILPTQPLPLNAEQAVALKPVMEAIRAGTGKTFLLHGVTGSGKTEIYLQAIALALELGKGAIVLVPEISLTPQTVERFKARFSSGRLKTLVAVLHSHLSTGERHDEWHKIRQGRARIVIGARSAVFAPVERLGLIIVDEEHENSYKQEETPRYHARDVAVMRGNFEQSVSLLGSATPSLESYYNARRGKYQLLEMLSRADDKKLPVVRVVDMRQAARKEKGTLIFSHQLREAITQRLEKSEQVMLFLNRRGYATSMQCPLCGYVARCPNCSVSLTYHRQALSLCCHICGFQEKAPACCPEPKCRNPEIRYAGLGTEKVEATLGKLFPRARIRRMDSDALKRKDDFRRILGDFRTGKIDVLVGTQMIAKGLHFPNVTLVGIIYADLSLHMPDFRAGERTFQLITQVAGRAGRGEVEGEVFVQAFTPFHPAIQYARKHDFYGFYEQEMEFRQQLKYPPISRAALLTLRSRNEEKVQFTAEHLKRVVEEGLKHLPDLQISGPAPAPLARAETYYRFQIMFRTLQMVSASRALEGILQKFTLPDDVTVVVDIDPMNLA